VYYTFRAGWVPRSLGQGSPKQPEPSSENQLEIKTLFNTKTLSLFRLKRCQHWRLHMRSLEWWKSHLRTLRTSLLYYFCKPVHLWGKTKRRMAVMTTVISLSKVQRANSTKHLRMHLSTWWIRSKLLFVLYLVQCYLGKFLTMLHLNFHWFQLKLATSNGWIQQTPACDKAPRDALKCWWV